jgi:8-oxo-dGTP pyrophosphatase MutT (NUDIX family)
MERHKEMKLKVAAKCVFVSEGKVLIMSDHGKWDFPGGGIEGDERLLDALRRELLEETGLTDFTIGDVIHADEWFIPAKDLHVVAVFYQGEMKGQPTPKQLSEEHTDFAWITPADVSKYDVTPDTIRALEVAII